MTPKKIFIIGISGSGKTYLAKEISKKLGAKHYDLDEIVFRKRDFTKVSDSIRDKRLKKILKIEKWIIEGSYSKEWVIPVIKKSDLILFLNINPLNARKRLLFRFLRWKFIKKQKYESLKDFIVLSGYSNKRVAANKKNFSKDLANKYKKKFIVLNNKKEINNFLESLK